MPRRSATRRHKKVRGGGAKRVQIGISWSVDGKNKMNFLSYATEEGARLSDLVDDIETHVEDAGYTFAEVPLRGTHAEEPKTLNTVSATWTKTGPPPTPGTLTIESPNATATFTVLKDQSLLSLLGGKRKKTRGRRRA